MPAAVEEKTDRSDQMWKALKAHILRERARKRQEREAEVEEERLRKEREAREQQDVMTLGETREQISQLELKLQSLKEEKHQLFLQLKKVLNEDDNRRRQLVKESNEMTIPFQNLPPLVQQQIYLPQAVPRAAPMPTQTLKASTTKRPRSPSPPPSVSIYHQGYGYKQPPIANPNYQTSPQKDNGRSHEYVRAVLWNKTPQYANQGPFYTVPPVQELSFCYNPNIAREPTRVYESSRPQSYHIEQKQMEHYSLRPPASHSHVIHGGSMPISPAQPPSKTGSITAGYPVRSQNQYQQAPAPASALYTAQSRPLYQSPSTPMNYPPRD